MRRIPADALIPIEKLTSYLLVPRPWDDKSKFLAQAGFGSTNPQSLLEAIRELAADTEAVADGLSEYGEFFRTDGNLIGPNGRSLPVTAIWLRWNLDGRMRFVTLKPRRERQP